jgi:hypothetical protein
MSSLLVFPDLMPRSVELHLCCTIGDELERVELEVRERKKKAVVRSCQKHVRMTNRHFLGLVVA